MFSAVRTLVTRSQVGETTAKKMYMKEHSEYYLGVLSSNSPAMASSTCCLGSLTSAHSAHTQHACFIRVDQEIVKKMTLTQVKLFAHKYGVDSRGVTPSIQRTQKPYYDHDDVDGDFIKVIVIVTDRTCPCCYSQDQAGARC